MMFPGIPNIFGPESSLLSIAYFAFTIWMLIECLRNDPDRYFWWWIIIVIPGIGPAAYFFVRWLPTHHVRLPPSFRGLARGREIRRLESAALQIGNAYQYVHLADALRETGRHDRAGDAYARALEKEPANLPALWGAALVDVHFRSYDSAAALMRQILEIDPQYKFGDVSLEYGKTLLVLQRTDEAAAHLEKHVQRWRHPEGIYLLAELEAQAGRRDQARDHLRGMLAEIDSSPAPIARRQGRWRRRGSHLLRKLAS